MIDWDAAVLGPCEAVFGESVTYRPINAAEFVTTGIFDEAYREVDIAGGMGVTTESPVLGIRMSQFSIPPMQGDQLTIDRTGKTYAVREVRSDSHGSARLMLNQVNP